MYQNNQDLKVVCSAIGATICAQCLYPFDVIKTRFQSHDGQLMRNLVPKYSSIRNAFQVIYSQEGIRGFGRGIILSLIANTAARSAFFGLYENRKKNLKLYYSEQTSVLLSSFIACWGASFVTQPIWVTNTRIQLNQKLDFGILNILRAVKQIFVQHGIMGFYRGFYMQMILALHGVIQINAYEFLKRNQISAFGAGTISKAFAIFLTYPFTTLRTRIMQNQYVDSSQEIKYKSYRDIIMKLVKNENFKGFYKGMSSSMIKGLPAQGIYFYTYEYLKNNL